MSPARWGGCGLQQCHQPWDGGQGASGATGGCSLPALLSWVDWAVPAMSGLAGLLRTGCGAKPVSHTSLAGRPLPSPGGAGHQQFAQTGCLARDGIAAGGTWPRMGDSCSLACGRCAQQRYLAHHRLVLLHQKDQLLVLLLHCTLLLLQPDQPLAVHAPAEVQVQLQSLYRGQNLCWLQLLLLCVLVSVGLPLPWVQHGGLLSALGHGMSSICLAHCWGQPILRLLPGAGAGCRCQQSRFWSEQRWSVLRIGGCRPPSAPRQHPCVCSDRPLGL